jgi:hypothetical protein
MTENITIQGRKVKIQWRWILGYTEFWIEGIEERKLLLTTDKTEVLDQVETIISKLEPLDAKLENFVQSVRDTVSALDKLPDVDSPLARFRDGLRAHLETYDKATEEEI